MSHDASMILRNIYTNNRKPYLDYNYSNSIVIKYIDKV